MSQALFKNQFAINSMYQKLLKEFEDNDPYSKDHDRQYPGE